MIGDPSLIGVIIRAKLNIRDLVCCLSVVRPQGSFPYFLTVVPFMSVDWEASISESEQCQRDELIDSESDDQAYDLSFAYRIQWEHPAEDLKEAVKVLLCARSSPAETPATDEHEDAMGEEERSRIRWLLVSNPNTPPPVLDSLVGDGSLVLLERIAEHPRTRATTLARLAFDLNPEVRCAVAENLNTPIETLLMLVNDEHPDVRFTLAEGYHVSTEILSMLCEDENPYVCYRAQRTLSRIHMKEAFVANFRTDWSGRRERRDRVDTSSATGFGL